jgi:uncharacterized membrane protein YsdA (DUF1294 family)
MNNLFSEMLFVKYGGRAAWTAQHLVARKTQKGSFKMDFEGMDGRDSLGE